MPFKVNKRGEETGIWLGDGISNRILSLLPLGQSFKSSLGHEHPPAPCHTGSLDPRGLGRQVSPALHMTLIHTTVHRWSQERPVGNKPALERRACWEPRPAQATLRVRWSERNIQQFLERAGPPSRPLLLQPLFWASNPICDGVTGNKTSKKTPKQNPHPLFTIPCSSTVV